jgi:hypothetical protein
MDGIVDQIAAGLYNLASMLVGEGEESVRLVETAIANTDVSACQDPAQARAAAGGRCARRHWRRLGHATPAAWPRRRGSSRQATASMRTIWRR